MRTTLVYISLLLFFAPGLAHACLDRDGLLDVNCDGQVIVALFGDSITYGVADELGLGYPGRLALIFPNVVIHNLGVPGEKSSTGRIRAGSTFQTLSNADFVISLEGINDYFLTSRSSSTTKSNLVAIRDSGLSIGAISVLGNLTQVKRSFQKSWVSSVNSVISPYTRINFFALGEEIISWDQLHPNGDGYQHMAELVALELLALSAENRPVDSDGDGIYDYAEPWFGSSISNPDSDGDGLNDGQEVFNHGSNPLLLDSDNDGYADYEEVTVIGSNPGDARPGAPRIQSIEILVEE